MATTTLTSWALLLWNVLKERGYDPAVPFHKAGADPARLGDGQARYSNRMMPLLWEAAVELTGDEDLGVAVGKTWHPTTFHALGFAWLASNTLHEGLQRLVRYSHIVNNSLIVQLTQQGAQYRFSLTTSNDLSHIHPAGSDAGIAAIVTMCRMLVGDNFSPVAMEMIRPHRRPGALEAFTGIPAQYNSKENVLLIDAVVANRELATGNSALLAANEQLAREYLQWLDKSDVVSAVKAQVVELLPAGQITEEKVAEKIHMNVRTLQRRLKENGHSFKEILNSTRQEIVDTHIRNQQMSLTEIAYLLGFSDQANFTRAFKRWTGLSPSEHRKWLLEQKKSANI